MNLGGDPPPGAACVSTAMPPRAAHGAAASAVYVFKRSVEVIINLRSGLKHEFPRTLIGDLRRIQAPAPIFYRKASLTLTYQTVDHLAVRQTLTHDVL